MLIAQSTKAFQKTFFRSNHTHVGSYRFNNHRCNLSFCLLQKSFYTVKIIIDRGHRILGTSLWYTGAVWYPTRHHTRTGTYQQRITVSMVTSGKFNDFVPSCIASGCTDRTHNCFCTGIYHTYHFRMWKMLTDKFCHFHFNLCSTSKAQAFRTCFYHCLPDFWKIMSKDHWSPGVNIINITVIIYIINMASIRTFDKSRCHSNCTISSYRTVNPSRNSFDRPFK